MFLSTYIVFRVADMADSLTDETIRKNFELYGHPDGRQEFSMGIAIPQFIIESKNNVWVLGLYGLIFGIGLPILVGRWWFGSRNFTKDGVQARTAELFFKSIKEDIGERDLVLSVGNALPWERPVKPTKESIRAVNKLREQIESRVAGGWMQKVDQACPSCFSSMLIFRLQAKDPEALRALILIYAHLLRLPIENSYIREGSQVFPSSSIYPDSPCRTEDATSPRTQSTEFSSQHCPCTFVASSHRSYHASPCTSCPGHPPRRG